jgi:L-ascorbate metabolism protein UlaG (beta-lactamase superfamily)
MLRDSVDLHLEYEDNSPIGTMVSGQLEVRLKRLFLPTIKLFHQNACEMIKQAPSIIADLGLSNYNQESFVCPTLADTRPAILRVDRPNSRPTKIALSRELVSNLASWLGEWQRDAIMPNTQSAKELWNFLADLECFEPAREPNKFQGVATFIGHATVLLTGLDTKILIDPFLLPSEESFPPSYQPLTYGDLEPDAILITHSHQDHFHIDSLLRLGKATPIFIPDVQRESALSVDMSYRLRELGFTNVHTLRWHEDTMIGDFRVIALPMYGEQPTTETVLNPDIRNMGNNYIIEGEGRRYAVIADAGRDHLGDVRSLATAAFEQYGSIDVLFGGYRSFSLYPIQYAFTSVPQYLLFTPRPLWGARQQIMNDAHALLDTAERWHASYVVPYANGGAPWYWQLGLGSSMDGGTERLDPRPEAVVQAATERSGDVLHSISSPTKPLVMRPGESLNFDNQGVAVILPNEGHLWPYAAHEALLTLPKMVEPEGLTRKRVLLRILAKEELKRRELVISVQQVIEMSDELRNSNGLTEHDQMLVWLDRAGLSQAEYCDILTDWQGVILMEELMADEIEKRLAGQQAFTSMREER